ncbi:hypothetical protein D3C73_1588220 [compost metagenome]
MPLVRALGPSINGFRVFDEFLGHPLKGQCLLGLLGCCFGLPSLFRVEPQLDLVFLLVGDLAGLCQCQRWEVAEGMHKLLPVDPVP